MNLRTKLIALAAPLLFCGCAALASALGVAAPIAGQALGAYAAAADDAQRQAGLPATDPEVIALRSALAALTAAEHTAETARQPVACSEPVPVDVDKLAAALVAVADSNRAVVAALTRVKAKKKAKPAPLPSSVLPFVDAGSVDASGEGGT